MKVPAGLEKREAQRIPVVLRARCRIGNRFVRESIGNLSAGGLYLETRERVEEGMQVRVALALPDGDTPKFCTLVGTVARVDRDEHGVPRGVGVSFAPDQISILDRVILRRFIALRAGSLVEVAV